VTRDQLEVAVLSLPRDERARLAEALISSLDEDAEISLAWREEIQRRLAEVEAGTVDMIPLEHVLTELDAIVEK
jgi:putative addiction module component (TIGR02574 family)